MKKTSVLPDHNKQLHTLALQKQLQDLMKQTNQQIPDPDALDRANDSDVLALFAGFGPNFKQKLQLRHAGANVGSFKVADADTAVLGRKATAADEDQLNQAEHQTAIKSQGLLSSVMSSHLAEKILVDPRMNNFETRHVLVQSWKSFLPTLTKLYPEGCNPEQFIRSFQEYAKIGTPAGTSIKTINHINNIDTQYQVETINRTKVYGMPMRLGKPKRGYQSKPDASHSETFDDIPDAPIHDVYEPESDTFEHQSPMHVKKPSAAQLRDLDRYGLTLADVEGMSAAELTVAKKRITQSRKAAASDRSSEFRQEETHSSSHAFSTPVHKPKHASPEYSTPREHDDELPTHHHAETEGKGKPIRVIKVVRRRK